MSDFTRPTLTELINRARADINGRMEGADSFLRRSLVETLAVVWAGLTFMLYGFLETMADEILPSTARLWLNRHAAIWKITPIAPTYAVRRATLTGINLSVVDANTLLQRSDGVQYRVRDAVTFAGTTATAVLVCTTAGTIGNALAGTSLGFVSPVSGVNSTAIVTGAGMTNGKDVESQDSLRARILDRIGSAPQGGNTGDYKRWVKEITGDTRVWVYENWTGLGKVGIAFVMDGRDNIIPTADEIEAVQDHIDIMRPVTAAATVFAPVAVPFNRSIKITPATAAVKAAVDAQLADLLTRDAEPGGKLLLSRINEAISLAPGETDHVLSIPAADVTYAPGHIATAGTTTWVP